MITMALAQRQVRHPGSGSPCRGGGAPAATLAESSASGLRLPRPGRPSSSWRITTRLASRFARETPRRFCGNARAPLENRLPGVIRAPPAPARPRAPPPGTVRPARRDPTRDATPFLPAGPARRRAAAPGWEAPGGSVNRSAPALQVAITDSAGRERDFIRRAGYGSGISVGLVGVSGTETTCRIPQAGLLPAFLVLTTNAGIRFSSAKRT